MQPFSIRPVLAIAALSAIAVSTGCQNYQPSPLTPASHRQAWHERTPADQTVKAFAQRLREGNDVANSDSPAAYDPGDGISMAEGELIALVYNPELRMVRLRAGVALATAEQAGRWEDPLLSLNLLRITQSVSDPWVVGVGLGITLPISGRLEAEQAQADAGYKARLLEIVEAEWKTRHEVRLAWLAWSAEKVMLQQQEELIGEIGTLVDATHKLAEAGEMSATEAGLFAIERMQRRYELRRLQGKVEVAEQRLRALMGLSPSAPLQLTPQVIAVDTDQANLDKRSVDAHPTLARLNQQYHIAEQTLVLEVRKQYPDLTIGPAVENEEGQSRIGLGGGIPLPILNRNRQGIAEAKAQRELARAAYETEYESLMGTLAQTRAKAKALAQERKLVAQEMAPLVDAQVARARELLDLGEGGGLVLLESLVRAYQTKLHLINVRLDEARAYAELAYLVGPSETPCLRPGQRTNPNSPSADSAVEVSP